MWKVVSKEEQSIHEAEELRRAAWTSISPSHDAQGYVISSMETL